MKAVARARGRQRRWEWAVLAVVLLSLVAWLSGSTALERLNHLVQDAGLRLLSRPARPDIVIVSIDDRSIAAIGRWPWRRALHAEVISRVSAQDPLAIGMDVLFSEEDLDYPQDDAVLAAAMRRSGRVVLPLLQRSYGASSHMAELPVPALASAAARLGHVHVVPDADGVVRSLYLQEGPAPEPWPHFSWALRCVATSVADNCPSPTAIKAPPDGGWLQADRTLIPYAGPPGHFTTYSYIDVLRGAIPPDAFRKKYVLVGAEAAGLGDMFATPVGEQFRLMPGVEVVAQMLDGQLSGVNIHSAPPAVNLAFNLIPVAGALVILLLAGPFVALASSIALALGTLVLSVVLPWWLGWQMAPAAALTGLVLAYPLWSWRRLSAAANFLRLEIERLQSEGLAMQAQSDSRERGDFLERRINAVERASRQLRDLHHFVSESLQQLPSPTLVCDPKGRILLANMAARVHLGKGNAPVHLQGHFITKLLEDLRHQDTGLPIVTEERLRERTMPEQSEGRDDRGRHLLLQCKPFTDLAQAGWLVTLVELTEIRRTQEQRDRALHFISHDIRAPNASILTLLEMHHAYPGRLADDELMRRIERYARTSLGMAENFVRLASAQSQEYQMAPLDLVAVLAETVDDIWAMARDSDVEVSITTTPETAPTLGDRALLCRTLANVLNNAVKFSPAGGSVHCAISERDTSWVVSIRDEGPGIPPELQSRLFEPFQRLHGDSHPGIEGVGLGLAFVHTVIQRHGGALEVESEVGHGTEFRLVLPLRQESATNI